jgi:hypothetical protein
MDRLAGAVACLAACPAAWTRLAGAWFGVKGKEFLDSPQLIHLGFYEYDIHKSLLP